MMGESLEHLFYEAIENKDIKRVKRKEGYIFSFPEIDLTWKMG